MQKKRNCSVSYLHDSIEEAGVSQVTETLKQNMSTLLILYHMNRYRYFWFCFYNNRETFSRAQKLKS